MVFQYYGYIVKAAEKAYNALRTGIVEALYPPGARITEKEIAAASGVSRTPVREAMRRLQAEGLLEFVPHQGAFVKAWSDADAEEIFELRVLLEPYAARRAAENATAGEISKMRAAADAQFVEGCDRKQGYLERIADLNDQFHRTLYLAARSDRLESILSQLKDAPLVFGTFRDYTDQDLQRSARHHLEIVQAIESGDGEWAASVMRSHVQAARITLQSMHKPDDRRKVRQA